MQLPLHLCYVMFISSAQLHLFFWWFVESHQNLDFNPCEYAGECLWNSGDEWPCLLAKE